MNNVHISVILITDSRVVHANFAGRHAPRQTHFLQEKRIAGSSFVQALESVFSRQKHVGRKTIVLDTSIWSQLVSLPRLSVLDVDESELNSALKFEVETLSGIDADEAVLGTKLLNLTGEPEQNETFWVNVVTRADVESASRLLIARGAKWIGLAHPAGVNFGSEPGTVQIPPDRIELWEKIAVLLHRDSIKSIASRSGNWSRQFGFDSLADVSDETVIIAESDELVPRELEKCERLSLENESALSKWMQNLAENAAKQDFQDLPFVISAFDRRSIFQQGLLQRIAVAVLILSFCFVHYSFLQQRAKLTDSQIADVNRPAIEKRNFDSQLVQVLNERLKLEEDAGNLQTQFKQIEFLFTYQTRRLERLLEMLMQTRTNDLVIHEIAPHEKGIVVKGVSLGGNSAPIMANQLRELAMPLGWRIHAPTQIGDQKMVSGGPWQFSILFEDVGPGDVGPIQQTDIGQPIASGEVINVGGRH